MKNSPYCKKVTVTQYLGAGYSIVILVEGNNVMGILRVD